MNQGIKILHVHIMREIQSDGRVIQDCFDARFNQLFGYSLCLGNWYSDHGDLYPRITNGLFHLRAIMNRELTNPAPDFYRITIEEQGNSETTVGKSLVACDGTADIANTHNH